MPRTSPAAVGSFVLGGVAIVVAGVLFFGGEEAFTPKTKAVVYFEGSVGGLGPGSPVTFRGVRVGAVSRVAITIDPNIMQALIPVELKLEPDRVKLASGSTGQPMLRSLIKAGLKAKLEAESLVTGQMLVDLDFVPDAAGHIVADTNPDIPEIPSVPSDLEELRRQLTHAPIADTLVQTKQTLAAIERVANRLDSVINLLADGALHTLDHTSKTMDVASTAIHDLQQSATTTLDDVQGLATDGRKQLATRGQELSRTLAAAERALQAARDLATSANSLVARGARPRDDLEAALHDLAASASSLRDLLQSVDRDPSVVLRGRGVR
jgi:paraquat-inducible protein B